MKISKELYDQLCTLRVSMIKDGIEYPNPIPKEVNVGFKRPPTLQEQIKRLIRKDLSLQALEQGMESEEEANDFEVDDGFETSEPVSKYVLMDEEFPQKQPVNSENRSGEKGGETEKKGSLDSNPASSPSSGSLPAEPASSDAQPPPGGE